jgi:hypothetical protein
MAFIPSENSRATVLVGYVLEHMPEVGDQLTYTEMLDLCGFDETPPDPATVLSGVVAEVNKRLHRAGDWRHLSNVQKVGYRIASPSQLRTEVFGRMRHVKRQHIANQRAIEKVIRHPDATAAERKRAADAASQHAALLTLLTREQRKIQKSWPAEEVSPVEFPEDGTP